VEILTRFYEILSQFDGPVTFNGKVNFNNDIRIKNVKANDLDLKVINAEVITVDSIVRIDNGEITSLSGNLEVNAASSVAIQTNTSVSGSLNVTGDSSFSGDLTISDLLTTDSLTVSNNTTIDGILTVSQIQTSSGNLTITPAASSSVAIQTNTSVSGTLTATGIEVSGSITGNGTIPVGGIIMWSGSIGSIPTGWALCDGNNGTPNLTDRFVVGAGSVYAVDATGGSANGSVIEHEHFVASSSGLTSDENEKDPLTDALYVSSVGVGGSSINDQYRDYVLETSVNEADVGRTNSVGISSINANLPPYYALAFIMRTT
jgi:cytoskeletal protein CcmA (bactofilin family)